MLKMFTKSEVNELKVARKKRTFLTEEQVYQIEDLLNEGEYTQEQIAKAFNISRSVVSRIKRGKHPLCQLYHSKYTI
jgi:predicted XRE-type DNA-binding protein